MDNIENIPLARIVAQRPETAKILEKYNLDFCCKGKQTLTNALSGNVERIHAVVKELNELLNSTSENLGPNFDELRLSDLIVYILNTHHRYVRESAVMIDVHLTKVAAKHGERHPAVIKIKELFSEVNLELQQHMIKEEEILFPMIISLETAYNSNEKINGNQHLIAPIQEMEMEHEHAGSIFDKIRKLTWNYAPPMDACTTFRLSFEELKNFEENLHLHVHLENSILFPKALEMKKKLSGIIFN